jgi:imidazoleglycerol-phosphate dehydratase
MSRIRRETRETRIDLSIRSGPGESEVETEEGFLTHMLETFARYGGLELKVDATGDLRHHLVEDVGITMGIALREEVPEASSRYGWAVIPMDDALVEAAVDLGGRPYYEGPLPSRLYEHFLQSFAVNLGATLHVRVIRGKDRHHTVETAVKAVGMAVRQALRSGDAVFSTKGSVSITRVEEE